MTSELEVVCQPITLSGEKQYRKQICRVGRWMYSKGLVVANEGNLSVRLDERRILVTPSGKCKGRLTMEDLLVTDLSGEIVRGTGRPSSEMLMHLFFYRSRPDVHAICHAHPPTATGFAAARRPLEAPVLPEVIVGLGKIPLASYGTPGTWEVCAGLEPLVDEHDAISARKSRRRNLRPRYRNGLPAHGNGGAICQGDAHGGIAWRGAPAASRGSAEAGKRQLSRRKFATR